MRLQRRGREAGSKAPWDIARFFTTDLWRPDRRPAPPIEIRLALDAAEDLVEEVRHFAGTIVDVCCTRLALPDAPDVVVTRAELATGEYEIVLSGAVRVAGSLATPWRSWWTDHPVAGPGGRTGVAPGPFTADDELEPAQKIARAVEEAVWDDPGPLLSPASAREVITGFGFDVPVWGEVDEYTAILRALASRRVPLRDTDKLAEGVRELEAADKIRRIEVLSCRCRPYEITVRLGRDLVTVLEPDDEEGRLQAQLLPFLHDGLYTELGVGFPQVGVHEGMDLPGRAYELVINGLPRAAGEIPSGKRLVNEAPYMLGGANATQFVNPANGYVASWADEARTAEWPPWVVTWDAGEFLVLHLAGCLREAAAEFADLAWTQQLFERLASAEERGDLVDAVDRFYSREVVSAVFCRLVQEGVTIRDLAFLLERMVELGVATRGSERSNGTAPVPPPGVGQIVEHVRRDMRDRLSHWATQSWQWGGDEGLRPVTRDMAVVELDDADVRLAQLGSDEGIGPAASGAFLRRLRQLLESWDRPIPPVLLTSRAARPHLRRAVSAQFPRVKVLAHEEVTPDVRLERVPVR